MIPNALVADVEAACTRYDRVAARKLVRELAREIRASHETFPAAIARRALRALRRERWFDLVLTLCEAVLDSGQNADAVRLEYAQALIDSGHLAAALAFLDRLIDGATPRSATESEGHGMVGRIYKQMYVNGGGEHELRADRLLRAFNAYYDVYAANPQMHWHGVNALALFARADRDEIPLPEIAPYAERLLAEASTGTQLWSFAIAAEAAVALGRFDEAAEWYARYAANPEADAFEIGGTLRQLLEVWQLTDAEPPGSTILPLLRGELLRRQGGKVEINGEEVGRELESVGGDLEKSFGPDRAQSLAWYREGLKRCLAVCCIRDSLGDAMGTGFIVRGADFGFADELLLMTNEHVLSPTHPSALREGQAYANFEAAPDRGRSRCVKILWSDRTVDATLARLDPPLQGIEPIDIAGTPELPVRDATKRVYIIGHPLGGTLSFSINDNVLLDYDDERLHYRAPTEPGSSGSPVFDERWRILALHRRGRSDMPCLNGTPGVYEANEGYRIDRIRALAKEKAAS